MEALFDSMLHEYWMRGGREAKQKRPVQELQRTCRPEREDDDPPTVPQLVVAYPSQSNGR